jgi:hypothetical protein
LRIAGSQVGVREVGRNAGPEVEVYLRSVGLGAGYPWCAAFVHWCFDQGSAALALDNPCPRTAGALRLYEGCPLAWKLDEPGSADVFVIDHGHGLGHVGFVESVNDDGAFVTIEGNTSGQGSREGDGVYRRARHRSEITRGYLRIGSS